jgi:hypothetical protein
MKLTTLIHGSDEVSDHISATREIEIEVYDNCIAINLAKDAGFAKDWNAARVWLEWKKDRGWVVILHNDENDPVGRVFLNDDRKAIFEED